MEYVIYGDQKYQKFAEFLEENIKKLVDKKYINFSLPMIYLQDLGVQTSSSYNPAMFIIRLNIADIEGIFSNSIPAFDRAFFTRVKRENFLDTPEKVLLFICLHEIAHVEQEYTGKVHATGSHNSCMWKGKLYHTNELGLIPGLNHTELPWEYDANMTAIALYRVAMEK